jgi:hypothetical protein
MTRTILRKNRSGEFYWIVVSHDGAIIANSTHTYESKVWATVVARRNIRSGDELIDQTDTEPENDTVIPAT